MSAKDILSFLEMQQSIETVGKNLLGCSGWDAILKRVSYKIAFSDNTKMEFEKVDAETQEVEERIEVGLDELAPMIEEQLKNSNTK